MYSAELCRAWTILKVSTHQNSNQSNPYIRRACQLLTAMRHWVGLGILLKNNDN